jgi:hypothetical protein
MWIVNPYYLRCCMFRFAKLISTGRGPVNMRISCRSSLGREPLNYAQEDTKPLHARTEGACFVLAGRSEIMGRPR